jgi:hypothetical protein
MIAAVGVRIRSPVAPFDAVVADRSADALVMAIEDAGLSGKSAIRG